MAYWSQGDLGVSIAGIALAISNSKGAWCGDQSSPTSRGIIWNRDSDANVS
jgi:hypothetical protein